MGLKERWRKARERAREKRRLEDEAEQEVFDELKQEYKTAYKEERKRVVRARAMEKARSKTRGRGGGLRTTINKLGSYGRELQNKDLFGMEEAQKKKPKSVGSILRGEAEE